MKGESVVWYFCQCVDSLCKLGFFGKPIEQATKIIDWEPTDPEESDCLIKTKQRDRLMKGSASL